MLVLPILFPYVFAYGHVIAPGYKLYEYAPWNHYGGPDAFPHAKYYPSFEYMLTWVPWYSIAQEAWSHGEWPLWNPYQLTGVPLLGNGQSAFFYPPRMLFAFLNVHVAGTINIILKVWLAALTAYYCGRALGLRVGGSLLLSICWMLAPMRMLWLFWSPADTLIWLPLQYCGAELLIAGHRKRGFSLIALSGALMLLAGHPETAFTMGLGTGLYFLVRVIYRYGTAPVAALKLAVLALSAWIAALLAASVQLLPLVEYLANSSTLAERATHDAPMLSNAGALVCMWVPEFYGISDGAAGAARAFDNSNWTAMYYPGWIVWLGFSICASSVFGRRRGAYLSARLVGLAAVSAVMLILAFRPQSFAFLGRLPLTHLVLHAWYFPFALFGMIWIACGSIQTWFATTHRFRELALPIACQIAIVIVAIVATLDIRQGALPETAAHLDDQIVYLCLTSLGAIAALVASCFARARVAAFLTVLILCTVDLLRIGSGIHPTCPRDKVEFVPDLIAQLREKNLEGRVLTLDDDTHALRPFLPRGLLQTYGVEDLLGHEGLYPIRLNRFYASCNLLGNMFDAFSIRCVISPDGASVPPQRGQDRFGGGVEIDGCRVVMPPSAWPRVKLVGEARVMDDLDSMFTVMNEEGFDPSRLALLESPLPHPIDSQSEGDPGEARLVSRTPNTVTAEVDAKSSAILVLTDQYYPGWKAIVDGNDVDVFPVYSLFRGVRVSAGIHKVTFYYDPLSFRIGFWVSAATFLAFSTVSIRLLRGTATRRRASEKADHHP
ncbi:MAG: YfhO family protein [Candidatus Hydrogenedentes bacterium]|nr:YfhO family protein [Candidatus Hydrogenedentota bacterium]